MVESKDVDCKGVERVEKWVSKWNQRFVVDPNKVPVQCLVGTVEVASTPLRRLLLEVFQYLSVKEIELQVGFACKQWFQVSRDAEYWKSRFIHNFQPATTDTVTCYRGKFIALHKGCCWSCKKFLQLDQIEMMCPLRNLPLCTDCSENNKECWVISLHSFVRHRYLHPSLPAYLNIQTFVYKNAMSCYYKDMAGKLRRYAERRRTLLLDTIERECATAVSGKMKAAIGRFRIKSLYRTGSYGYDRLGFVLASYFGRNESRERLDETMREVLSKIQEIDQLA